MYKKYLLASVTALVLSPITETVHASPSFDCGKASQKVERLICSDSGLSLSDRELANDYQALTRELKGVAADKLQADQRLWLKQRNDCQDLVCVRASYERRRYELNPKEGFTCLEKQGDKILLPASNKTQPHLTVSWFHFFDEITVKFTGIPISSHLEPYTEGCEDTDSSILIYKTKDDTPLFYRTGNIRGEITSHAELLSQKYPGYKKLGELTKPDDLILTYTYIGNCGGCFSAVVFARKPTLSIVAEYYFDPAKYGEPEGPTLTKYDSKKRKLAVYKIE
jgi:uncharacterized protein YecT (DUF1311 family)